MPPSIDTQNFNSLTTLSQPYSSSYQLYDAFRADSLRFTSLSLQACGISVDLSKQRWSLPVVHALQTLADSRNLQSARQHLLTAQIVNSTENRPAEHAHWRMSCLHQVTPAMQHLLGLATQIRSRQDITHVVHIGIGGSGLGPDLALQALTPWCNSHQEIRIVSNLDGHDLQEKLQGLKPQNTLFIVVSKSWGTHETLRNAKSALQWFQSQGGMGVNQHFVAVTSRPELAAQFGIDTVLPMSEGMGGRFSIWSAVGLPVAIAIGPDRFLEFVRGGAAMDQHFAEQPWETNLPVWLGLLDVWNSTFLGQTGRCVAPYHHGLRRLPAYLQQLEMESNGKRVDIHGQPLSYNTAGLTWGEEGSNGQHAFFQWLHQGTCNMSTEFIVVKQPTHDFDGHHEALMANALAQSRALMIGSKASGTQLPGHQDFPGNRPSTTIVLDELTPTSLGSLLAMYEHRVFVAGVIWGINSFDQWGVELGKTLAKDLTPRFQTGDTTGLDPSTAGLLGWLREESTSKPSKPA